MDFLKKNRIGIAAFALMSLFFLCYYLFFAPPSNFPSGNIVVVAKGVTSNEVAKNFSDAHIISRQSLLKFLLRISGTDDQIRSGAYQFSSPQNIFVVAHRLTTGDFGMPMIKITFPEGTTLRGITAQISDNFSPSIAKDFAAKAASLEGYLFPDTYFFQSTDSTEKIIETMRENFDEKIYPLSSKIFLSGHSLSDVVIMASLIEKEAKLDVDKHIIAGILWRRLSIGMPLQVDAASETYKHTGLPKTPICNPGLESIESVLSPTKTDYLYYLTGHDGLMHYGKTFEEHQANLRKYL